MNRDVIQYRIVESEDKEKLEATVQELFQHGWELHGPPHIFMTKGGPGALYFRYCQAMILRGN